MLVGLMATGKSTVGRMVADKLDRPFFDSDDQVEDLTGRTVREIWQSDGEETFRRLEAEALAAALDADIPSVIAGAGGVVLSEPNRRRLSAADAVVVWLRAEPATLLARIEAAADQRDGGHRPLLDDDPAGMLESMARDRSDLYAEVADCVIDVDGRSPRSVARAVVSAVKARAKL